MRERASVSVGACLTIIGVLGFTGLTAVIAVEGWPSGPPAERVVEHRPMREVRQVVLGGAATRAAARPSSSGTTTRPQR